MNKDTYYTDDNTYFKCPIAHPPPAGRKIYILTSGMIVTIGHWRDDGSCIAWAGLHKIPDFIKQRVNPFKEVV